MTITNFSRQHVDELHAHVSEIGMREARPVERDEKGLDAQVAGKGMAEQVIEMASSWYPAVRCERPDPPLQMSNRAVHRIQRTGC